MYTAAEKNQIKRPDRVYEHACTRTHTLPKQETIKFNFAEQKEEAISVVFFSNLNLNGFHFGRCVQRFNVSIVIVIVCQRVLRS